MKSACMLIFLLGFLGCETRGVSGSIVLTRTCYSGAPGQDASIHAQVKDASSAGAANVKVRWQLTPVDDLVTISVQTTTSEEGDVEGLRVEGLVAMTAHVGEASAIGSSYTILVHTLDEGALSASSRLVIARAGTDGCTPVDAGVTDAVPTDGEVDAASGSLPVLQRNDLLDLVVCQKSVAETSPLTVSTSTEKKSAVRDRAQACKGTSSTAAACRARVLARGHTAEGSD